MRTLFINDANGLKMRHELREIFEVPPEGIEFAGAALDGDGANHANGAVFGAAVAHADAFLAGLLAGENIEGGHAGDHRCCEGKAFGVAALGSEGGAEQRQIHDVANHARPKPFFWAGLRENADAAGDFTNAKRGRENLEIAGGADAFFDAPRG